MKERKPYENDSQLSGEVHGRYATYDEEPELVWLALEPLLLPLPLPVGEAVTTVLRLIPRALQNCWAIDCALVRSSPEQLSVKHLFCALTKVAEAHRQGVSEAEQSPRLDVSLMQDSAQVGYCALTAVAAMRMVATAAKERILVVLVGMVGGGRMCAVVKGQ